MKPADVFAVLGREVAPVSLSDELCATYGAYDNSGIIADCGNEVSGVLFCLDLTSAAYQKARALGYNLIVTHHPAIFTGIKSLSAERFLPTAALTRCLQGGISVISMHLNFDAAPKGIDYYLMRGLGGEKEEALLNPLSEGGYGRVYSVAEQSFENFCTRAAAEFSAKLCRFYGSGAMVKKVASFCGAGTDEDSIAFAIAHNADTFVSADMKHHHISALREAGLNVMEFTHYASEIYGFARIYASIKDKIAVPSQLFEDSAMM